MLKSQKQDLKEADDKTLFEMFRRHGDESAFSELVSRHSAPLMRYLQALLGEDSAHADDIYQETWVKVIANSSKWSGGSFRAWITRIARNSAIDMFRKRKPTLSLDVANDAGVPFSESIPDEGAMPGDELEGDEVAVFVAEEVLKLPEAQREVFIMRVNQEMSFREIADVLEIPINTALGRMHYALGRLRERLSDKISPQRKGERNANG